MTAFTKDMIPPSIATTEALAVWVAEVHAYNYGATKITEALDNDGEPLEVYATEADVVFITATDPPEHRHLARHSILLRPEYRFSRKVWEKAMILGDKEVPMEMRV